MKQEVFELIALSLTRRCSKILLKERKSMTTSQKKDNSLVTSLDVKLEKIISEGFLKYFNYLNIQGEELGNEDRGSEYTLVIDPIDGTKSFIEKEEEYAITFGITKNSQPLYGLVHDVARNRIYVNGRLIGEKSNKEENIFVQGNPKTFEDLKNKGLVCKFKKHDSTALGLVRAGFNEISGYINNSRNLKDWDIIPALGVLKYIPHLHILGVEEEEFDIKRINETGISIIR